MSRMRDQAHSRAADNTFRGYATSPLELEWEDASGNPDSASFDLNLFADPDAERIATYDLNGNLSTLTFSDSGYTFIYNPGRRGSAGGDHAARSDHIG